jgi:hypothetical protein
MAGTNTWSKSTIKGEMNGLWLNPVRGNDKPDLIVASHDIYAAYEESAAGPAALQRPVQEGVGRLRKPEVQDRRHHLRHQHQLRHHGREGVLPQHDYLYLIQHPEAQWTQDDEKKPTNQDAVVVPMYWMGQLCCDLNRSRRAS